MMFSIKCLFNMFPIKCLAQWDCCNIDFVCTYFSKKWKGPLRLPGTLVAARPRARSQHTIIAHHTHSISIHCHEGRPKYPNHIGKTHLVLRRILYHSAGITDQLASANMKCETVSFMASFLEINTCSSPRGRGVCGQHLTEF